MNKYNCHKVVKAAIIVDPNVGGKGSPNGAIYSIEVKDSPESESYIVEVGDDIFARGKPEPGDYLVVYGDDYTSWSPKAAFEDGYTLQEELPRKLTPEYIASLVDTVNYHRPLGTETLTICVLTLINGFTVVGTSAYVDPAEFKEQLGKEIAHKDALEKIWPLEGYLLHHKKFG